MRHPLVPLLLLLALEGALAALLAVYLPAPSSSLTTLLAGGTLAIGLAPALARPAWFSARVAALGVLLASLIWHAGTGTLAPPPFAVMAQRLDDPRVALLLTNGALMVPLLLHNVARFPRHSGLSDWLLGAVYAGFGALIGATLLAPTGWRAFLLVALALGVYAGLALAGWLLVRAMRDPRPEHRLQLAQARLLLVGLFLAVAPVLALPLLQLSDVVIPAGLLLAVQICFPLAIAYAVLRHDLLGIDLALRRALGYAGTSLGFLAIYFGLTTALTLVLRELTPLYPGLSTILGVLGAASAFPWMQAQAQRLITRAFYPERLTFQQDLAAAQATLSRVVRRDEVVALLVHELPARLGAQHARLHLLPAPPPSDTGSAWSAPLLVSGRQLGTYWLGARRTGLPYAPDEQERLWTLLQQAALALAYAESYEALAVLNAELEARVTARTEQLVAHQRELAAVAERQRLARDLHDSLKQTLFSLGLNLHAAAGLSQRDPERARGLLAQQAERVVQAQSDLADLLSELRMPLRTSDDLVGALRFELAQLETQHGFRVTLDAPPRLELAEPACRELAAVAREGLHNTLKHSGVAAARVTVGSDGEHVLLALADQGRGFDPEQAWQSGHGLRGMQERVAALRGNLTITAAPGKGTRLWVSVPLRPQSEF